MIQINENFGKENFKEMCTAVKLSPNLFVNVRVSHQNSESGSKKAR